MPLYKRKTFPLSEPAKDLKPQDLVFQIRFTKEIFKDYSEYLKRLNFYRRKVWTCKFTGKSNLTYEEALVSELKASEKIQQFPKEFIGRVLRDVQFSMAPLRDLANSIAAKLQEPLLEGCELLGKKNNRVYPCKIVKVLEDNDVTKYEVAWLDKDKKITGNALVKGEDLTRNKLPFTREVLKSFIRDSTYRNVPWVIHEELAKQHGISTDPPDELKDKISIQDGVVVNSKKRKKPEERKDIKADTGDVAKKEDQEQNGESIKYPIEDLLVQPSNDDQRLSERPSPHSDFTVPMDCVGDFLMVWEFCTSFGRFLHLSPFPIEDFGYALCHKDSNLVLVTECHSALLRLLMKDNGEYFITLTKKKRKLKITLVTWSEYLCDFLEMSDGAELSTHCSTIRRGYYGLLDVHVKLKILVELVVHALDSEVFREYLDECIDEQKAFAAAKRDEVLEEGRKKREEKRLKVDQDNKAVVAGCGEESGRNKPEDPLDQNHCEQKQDVSKVKKNGCMSSKKHSPLNSSDSEQGNTTSDRNAKKQRTDTDVSPENANDKRAVHKMMKNEIKEVIENKNKEQRKQYLEREIEKRYVRTNPLGKDKDYYRYWFFQRDGRIFVESSDSRQWGYYCTKEELDAFLNSLNSKGVRERALKKQVEKYYDKICLGLLKRAKDTNQKIEVEDEASLRRSTRVRAPPKDNPALAFLKYTNKSRED
ncbi:hypothetical protein Leryth_006472 [Lithospermum erythrorhizon]|nr:hypothetical protein Leryth_006472 [Lithospermum erythrorhizon]